MAKTTKNQIALKNGGASPKGLIETERDRDLSLRIAKVHEYHAQCEQLLATSMVAAVQSGELLNSLKPEFPHGSWETFLSESFPTISVRTLQRYMKVSRFVRDNPESLREFIAKANPELNLNELSDRDLLSHLTWESAQPLMARLSNEKSAKKALTKKVRSLSHQVVDSVQNTLRNANYELHSDAAFDIATLPVDGEQRTVNPKSLQVKGTAALIITQGKPLTGDCLDSLKRNIRQDQAILVIAPLKHLSERAYAELPHIVFHGVSLFDGDPKDTSDYFIALIGGDERTLNAFQKSSHILGTFCVPYSTQQSSSDAGTVVVES